MNDQQPEVQAANNAEARLERIENGLLPQTYLKTETPLKCNLRDRMAHYDTPGIGIAIIDDYRIVSARGYGVADADNPALVTTETLFQAASISKPVTAMAVLKLVQDGVLDLDEDVNRYLVSWKVPQVGDWQPRVTLRQLLSHTAGLTVHGFLGYSTSRPVPTVVQILNGEAPANSSPVRVAIIPGTQWQYSGGGTTIVQLLLTDVIGKPFPEIMREIVLDPLEMSHSSYDQPLSPDREQFASSAHSLDARPIAGKWRVHPEMAAAGLWTTPSDLARFAIEIQLSVQGRSNRVLSVETTLQMLSPQLEDHMGLGPFLEGSGETARFGHGGANEGFLCELTAYKNRGQGCIVMINSSNGGAIISEIKRAIAAEYAWSDYSTPPPTPVETVPDLLDNFVGTYEFNPKFKLTVTKSSEGLQVQPTGQPAFPIYATSATTFFATVVSTEFTFQQSESGIASTLTFVQNGKGNIAKRVDEDVYS